jgi:hypothetical protein
MVNSVRTIQSAQLSSFSVLTARCRSYPKQDKRREVSLLSNGYIHSQIQQTVQEL